MSTAITPQVALNGDNVTTNSAQATANRLRFTVARINNQGVTLTLALMLGQGIWKLTDTQFVVPPTGATREVDEHIVETPNLNDRYMLVYQGQQGNPSPLSGITVYYDVMTAPASNTSVPTAGSVVTASFAAGAVDSAAIGADAVTLGKIAPTAFRKIANFTGRNGAGACTATGAKVGDVVLGISIAKVTDLDALDTLQAGLTAFEGTITVANQIQQTGAADLSAVWFDLLLLARS